MNSGDPHSGLFEGLQASHHLVLFSVCIEDVSEFFFFLFLRDLELTLQSDPLCWLHSENYPFLGQGLW